MSKCVTNFGGTFCLIGESGSLILGTFAFGYDVLIKFEQLALFALISVFCISRKSLAWAY